MPAVRGRTVSTLGGFLRPIGIDGGQPRKGGIIIGRGVFTITRTGRGVDGLPARAGRGIFTITRTGRGRGVDGLPARAGRGIFTITRTGRGGGF